MSEGAKDRINEWKSKKTNKRTNEQTDKRWINDLVFNIVYKPKHPNHGFLMPLSLDKLAAGIRILTLWASTFVDLK